MRVAFVARHFGVGQGGRLRQVLEFSDFGGSWVPITVEAEVLDEKIKLFNISFFIRIDYEKIEPDNPRKVPKIRLVAPYFEFSYSLKKF